MKMVNKVIEMIAEFFENGQICPIRFRLHEGDELIVFQIKNVLYEEKVHQTIRKYMCDIACNDALKKCEIIFDVPTMIWKLARIE